ncbi:MAG: metallophosphoesterase [Phycisphaerae bacterium]
MTRNRFVPAVVTATIVFLVLGQGRAGDPVAGPASAPARRSPQARAAEPATRPASGPARFAPFVFIHGGDSELGSPDLPGTAKRLRLFIDQVNQLKPAFLVMAGDLVHGGTIPAELKALDDAFAACRVPIWPVPGNHDNLAQFRSRFGREYYALTHNNCEFVCLDTEDLSAPQVSWLEDTLKTARRNGRTYILVVMHHPPEGNAALEALFDKYKVSAVFAGHLHKTIQTAHKTYTTYVVSGSAKVRDDRGLTYGIVRVGPDGIDYKVVPLLSAPAAASAPASVPAAVRR